MTDVENIISQLEQQKEAIDRALTALREITNIPGRATKKSGAKRKFTKRSATKRSKISEEGRQKLAEAMKRRWAAKRAAAKKSGGGKKAAA